MVASVVVLPLPVGPVTAIIPWGRSRRRRDLFFVARRQAQFGNVEQTPIARQQAYDRGFAVLCRHGRDTHVEIGTRHLQSRCAILGETPFRDVESGENLDA